MYAARMISDSKHVQSGLMELKKELTLTKGALGESQMTANKNRAAADDEFRRAESLRAEVQRLKEALSKGKEEHRAEFLSSQEFQALKMTHKAEGVDEWKNSNHFVREVCLHGGRFFKFGVKYAQTALEKLDETPKGVKIDLAEGTRTLIDNGGVPGYPIIQRKAITDGSAQQSGEKKDGGPSQKPPKSGDGKSSPSQKHKEKKSSSSSSK